MVQQAIGRYQKVIERSSDIITVLDRNGVIQFESPSIERLLGYEPDQLADENVFGYVHPDDREHVRTVFEDVVGPPEIETTSIEYRFRHESGSWVDLESTIATRSNTPHDNYVISSRDISQRKQRERELAEERNKYSAIIEQTHDGIVIVQDERFVFLNARFAEIHGYREPELLGESFAKLIAPEDLESVQEDHEQRLDPQTETSSPYNEARFLTKGGEQRVAEISAAHIQYEGESAELVTVRDVTERKQYEKRLKRMTEEFEMLNRIIRHDIRNDISIILGWAELLETYVDERGRGYLEKIVSAGEHIVELTETARDYVEALTTQEEVEVKPVALHPQLKTEIELRRKSFREAEFSIQGGVPEVEVMANEMLGSVFRNLLNNAVHHSDTDNPVVEVSCEVRSDEVVVRVADNGPGVPDDQRDTIFAKNEKGIDSSGTGIGLHLVRTLIEQYDGNVWVTDNDPRGAMFAVRLHRPAGP